MMNDPPLFTIFTPTFNRAHTLHRVFDSLKAQSLQDFEWLIVDDGSTDQTAETVAAWEKVAQFKIRYVRQEHAGKHIAHNRALKEARGRLFAVLDSDDALLPHALERMHWHWNSILESERLHFWAVESLACDENGQLVGNQYPASPFDSNLRDLRYIHRVLGEKFRVSPTEILRRYPFPEISETQFIPEGVVWFEIAKTYKQRSVNEVCRVYYCHQPKTDATLSSRNNLATTARGRLHYYVWLLNNDIEYFFRSPVPFLKAALMMPTASFFSQCSFWRAWGALQNRSAKWLIGLVSPVSALLYCWYRLTVKRTKIVE
jgi:glycosyltransferase involved in cell wall biosynthesis